MPAIMQTHGRKIAHILLNVTNGTGFIMLASAQNVTTLYAARCIQGISICGVYLATLFLAEYSHPTRRGYFTTLKLGAVAFGSLSCHSLVLICTWRQIAAIAVVPNLLGVILTLPWPESPAYLAMKGKYEECYKAYKFLHGDTVSSKKEVEDVIAAQKKRQQHETREGTKQRVKLSTIANTIMRKDFTKPLFIITLFTVIIDSGGRYYNLGYIVQIVEEITGDNSIGIYCSMVLDVLTIIACWTSTYVITKFTRRTIMFAFGYLSVALMFSISLIVFLKSNNIATNAVWLMPCIILFNSFIVHIGVIPVSFTVSGEIFPLEHRGCGFTATGIIFTLLYAVTMKCTPIMMEKTGIGGTYGIYGLCSVVCYVILNFILTETKDKTLQEIENEMKNIAPSRISNMQEKQLLAVA